MKHYWAKAENFVRGLSSLNNTAAEQAEEISHELRFNNISLHAAPLVVDEELSRDIVRICIEWDTEGQLAEHAVYGNSLLENKIKSLAVSINPAWTQKKLLIKMNSFRNLQAELFVSCS